MRIFAYSWQIPVCQIFQKDQELLQITGKNEAILGIYRLKHQMNICLEASKIKSVRSTHAQMVF
jgi:hypothetical protein